MTGVQTCALPIFPPQETTPENEKNETDSEQNPAILAMTISLTAFSCFGVGLLAGKKLKLKSPIDTPAGNR